MASIIEVVRDDLDMNNVRPAVLEKVPSLIRRAIIKLQDAGAFPPRITEFQIQDEVQEKRDGHGNLIYEFFFLPDDFGRLDKFVVYNSDSDDNESEDPYQWVAHDLLFTKRQETDERRFFAITDLNIGDERSRKILVLDPMPDTDEYIELRYFPDGTETNLDTLNQRYWEPIITQIHEILRLTTPQQAEKEIARESARWRNQQGKDSFNKTHISTTVRYPFGKT